ncbi:LPS export ABC transporter permease LptG [Niveispirillum fermenti]|uniref:LPS export ABC transporter permease LptG n=1 Tax=Niveispirillum fermenti TaxID=1233113 RepID=UPI003A8528DE
MNHRSTITRYLTRTFLIRVLSVLIALSALLQLLDLLDAASTVLERGLGAGGLMHYTIIRLPMVVERIVPLAVLIGSLSTLWTFASTNEIVAMRSVGMTPYQIMGALLPAALIVAIGHFLLADQVAPRAERAFVTWWNETALPDEGADDEPAKPVWFRLHGSIMRVASIAEDGRRFEGLEVVDRDAAGRATALMSAQSGEYVDRVWRLTGVVRTHIGDPVRVEHDDGMVWDVSLSPGNMVDLSKPMENISIHRLIRIVRGTWAGGESPAFYATRLHSTYAAPLASLVMLLLAAPVAHGMRRRGGAMGSMALGTVIGLVFLLSAGILGSMGQAGVLPPLIAVWAPLLLFAAIGGAIMVYVEG